LHADRDTRVLTVAHTGQQYRNFQATGRWRGRRRRRNYCKMIHAHGQNTHTVHTHSLSHTLDSERKRARERARESVQERERTSFTRNGNRDSLTGATAKVECMPCSPPPSLPCPLPSLLLRV
jgi:hypothetical protein